MEISFKSLNLKIKLKAIRVLKSIEKLLLFASGGCPKRKVCGSNQAKNKTCVYGPYEYCGKYRSIIEEKKKTSLVYP
jgi:hypothetical protein